MDLARVAATVARMRPLAVLLTLVVTTAGLACGGSPDETAAPPPPPPAATTSGGPDTSREKAPALVGVTLGGERIALGDFRGRPVLVNVWSSW